MSIHRLAAPGAILALIPLTGCMERPGPVSGTRQYAIDQGGAARQCKVGPVALAAGKESTTAMAVGNDGGRCSIVVALDGHPYAAGLLTTPAAHGKVYVHAVGDDTRIDYTPDTGFAGADAFTVTLLPGRPVLRVGVTVTR